MGKRLVTPDTVQTFTELAQPYFHAGSETGCLLMHGFTGTPANVRFIAEALASAGHTVYSPMLSGHGTSLRDMDVQRLRTGCVTRKKDTKRSKKPGAPKFLCWGIPWAGY